ncbi:MAG: GTP-binding protein, partial [Candidatus Pacebacteria bacterium]|nr:GTP-binding protein [Candidatus Paceibacterota bacterium]
MALQTRPPIITIMGHVDHGKTTLLDYIRQTRVQAKEAGGITQHIGAYQIEFVPEAEQQKPASAAKTKNSKAKKSTKRKKTQSATAKKSAQKQKLTFIDTPGHAAFNKMRQRGAQVTDLVILIVAANDGVKPQTIESLRYIRESKVPFLVAINKIDLPDVRLDDVKSQLAEQEVLVSDYGGDVEVVEISAKTGKGVDKLLETVVVMAELLELKADPQAPLEAAVIESTKDAKRGPVASVVVKQGTLRTRQDLLTETAHGRVRLLTNEQGQHLQAVKPGSPAEIIGFKQVPSIGEIVRDAQAEYQQSQAAKTEDQSAQDESTSAESQETAPDWSDLDIEAAFGEKEKIKLIVRADVKGTLEAILQNFDEDSVDLVEAAV